VISKEVRLNYPKALSCLRAGRLLRLTAIARSIPQKKSGNALIVQQPWRIACNVHQIL
jgi:hypothetical protein